MHRARPRLDPEVSDRGVYPGSFSPLTRAHLAIAEAAVNAHGLSQVDLALSRVTLEKEHIDRPIFQHRLEVLEHAAIGRPWLGVAVTDDQLIADIATGYAVVVMGADKWAQVWDPRFYDSIEARNEAVRSLPKTALAPRDPFWTPAGLELDIGHDLADVSSTRARAGETDLMAPEAAAFDRQTGAWTDPDRYERWLHKGSIEPG